MLKNKKVIIGLTFSLHLLGILVAFFKTKNNLPFDLSFHLLRFFAWWSVHSSILAILATFILAREDKKKTSSWLSQFIPFLSVIFNLTTFLFCLFHLFFGALKWQDSLFLNLNSITWHFIAPLLTIYCFYSWVKIDILRKKLARSVLCSFIWPFFYFVYVYSLSFLNSGSNKLSLYLKKYPYLVFQFMAKNPVVFFAIWLPVALLTILILFALIVWTKIIFEKKVKIP